LREGWRTFDRDASKRYNLNSDSKNVVTFSGRVGVQWEGLERRGITAVVIKCL
jgi:hypothetical protein